MVREVVILSGKGGTGKTTVAAGLVKLFAPAVVVDADVDAADLFILLEPVQRATSAFFGLGEAFINAERCTRCGICGSLCRFGAITAAAPPRVVPHLCEGCGLCVRACPAGAIELRRVQVGEWYCSDTSCGPMVHARLTPGAENSGKLVTAVRRAAREIADGASHGAHALIITDGPPGIGCPVTASITGADLALLVTEPTLSGVHDLERIAALAAHFGVPSAVVVNKADLHTERFAEIVALTEHRGIPLVATIPFSPDVMEAQMRKRTPADLPATHPALRALVRIHDYLANLTSAATNSEDPRAPAT